MNKYAESYLDGFLGDVDDATRAKRKKVLNGAMTGAGIGAMAGSFTEGLEAVHRGWPFKELPGRLSAASNTGNLMAGGLLGGAEGAVVGAGAGASLALLKSYLEDFRSR